MLGNDSSLGHAFHITSDEVLTWDQIYRTIGEAAGVEPKLVHVPSEFLAAVDPGWRGTLLGDKSHSAVFDNTKIKRFVPGYAATIPFHQGARRTLAWFEADPVRQRVVRETDERMDAKGHRSHSGAIFVTVNNAPIRASASDAEFFVHWIDNLLLQTSPGGAWSEFFHKDREAAQNRYRRARAIFERIASDARNQAPALASEEKAVTH